MPGKAEPCQRYACALQQCLAAKASSDAFFAANLIVKWVGVSAVTSRGKAAPGARA
jgi:hypothetical protein